MSRQPEGRLVRRIQKLIEERGGRCFKIHGGGDQDPYQEAGIPDLLVCYHGRFVGLEVKQPGEKPSKLQLYVLDEIRYAGGHALVVSTVEEVADLLAKIEEEGDE